jgi:hypothetical protein
VYQDWFLYFAKKIIQLFSFWQGGRKNKKFKFKKKLNHGRLGILQTNKGVGSQFSLSFFLLVHKWIEKMKLKACNAHPNLLEYLKGSFIFINMTLTKEEGFYTYLFLTNGQEVLLNIYKCKD